MPDLLATRVVVRNAAPDPGRGLDIIAGVPTDYHRIAGSNLDRLAALCDGIFAVAMTLLVLDLRVPVLEGLHTDAALWHELGKLTPRLLTYFLSFLTLGIFWIGQQTQLNQLTRSDRNLTWIHLGFLLGVSLPRLCDECVTTFLFSTFSTARQGVGSRARTADRDARVPQPKPVGWLDANSLLKHHVAWHATLAALHR